MRKKDVIQQIVGESNRYVNEASPIVDARLKDGSRVNVVLNPVAVNGPILTIRKFPSEAITMEQLIRIGSVTDEAAKFLKKLVAAKYNIFVSGGTGAGKTTLCSLIPRFYDVTEGRVLLDGQDIRKLKLHSLRSKIGIVQQDVYLFAGTVMENIRYGKPDATDEEVIQAAKAANAHDFIMELDDGYNTDIGQRGVKLSGGQKQRLSIARVFLKNPPILIFDEATSALDNESEKIVQDSLEKLSADRTTFVIAHRLSTIRKAQRILVLTEDGIAEEGTHQELMEKEGIYSSLYKLSFS